MGDVGGPINNFDAKEVYCKAVPSGSLTSLGIAFGGIGSVGGSIDTVHNYNSGQTSVFATGGFQAGWNGGGSVTETQGLIWGLDKTNNGYKGPFKGGALYAPTPVPSVGAGGGYAKGGGVTVAYGGLSAGLVGRYGGGRTWTKTTSPLNIGKFADFGLGDYLGYLLRRPCN
jgi:hypothetical protein